MVSNCPLVIRFSCPMAVEATAHNKAIRMMEVKLLKIDSLFILSFFVVYKTRKQQKTYQLEKELKFASLLLGPEFLEVGVVLLKQLGSVERIGALTTAGVAVLALLDFLHLLGPFLGEVHTQRGSA